MSAERVIVSKAQPGSVAGPDLQNHQSRAIEIKFARHVQACTLVRDRSVVRREPKFIWPLA